MDREDPGITAIAQELLDRHREFQAEQNIASLIRQFLVETGLFNSSEIREQVPIKPLRADLVTPTHIFEFKWRIGSFGKPDERWVLQLDTYLKNCPEVAPRVRWGILTDGRHWLKRWPGQLMAPPETGDIFELKRAEEWSLLYEWLFEQIYPHGEPIPPSGKFIEERLGPYSQAFRVAIDGLRGLRERCTRPSTIDIKQELWSDLLAAALGERAKQDKSKLDDLFLRHTYLSAVVGAAVHSAFGFNVTHLAESAPGDLLKGTRFFDETGIHGVVNQGFFSWPAEIPGFESWVASIANAVAEFDWRGLDQDFARLLYESVISADERRELGEYYTPQWLADAVVDEAVTDPLEQSVLDPACGSGTFLWAALKKCIAAGRAAEVPPDQLLDRVRNNIIGIDVHPVAVLLARATWLFAVRELLNEANWRGATVPVYLGDSLQLRTSYREDQLTHQTAIIPIRAPEGRKQRELRFPVALVDQGDWFDEVMLDLAREIESDGDPIGLLRSDRFLANDQDLQHTVGELSALHAEGRNHIWAYYTRNLVRPIALRRRKVDVIVGNPPWINFNQSDGLVRNHLKSLSERYGIWAGGRYATNQDMAGLFFAHCAHLYLANGGSMGFVLPHSALQTGQWAEWRKGTWNDGENGKSLRMDLAWRLPWDLEGLEPNDFFPVTSCVVFGKLSEEPKFANSAEKWIGAAGKEMNRALRRPLFNTSFELISEYGEMARQGAVLAPRSLFFVERAAQTAIVSPPHTEVTTPRRGTYDREPWKSLDLAELTGLTIESDAIFEIQLGETLAPYCRLNPLRAFLPIGNSRQLALDGDSPGGVDPFSLPRRARTRWQKMAELWDRHKTQKNSLALAGQIDYYGKLSAQLDWVRANRKESIRVVYAGIGRPTAAVLEDPETIVDTSVYWIPCDGMEEARYLLGVINSRELENAVIPLVTPSRFGKVRNLHKHLWRLPIPTFDEGIELHAEIARIARVAESEASGVMDQLIKTRPNAGVSVIRRQIREWQSDSSTGKSIEALVAQLLREAAEAQQ
ncbi:MAG: N-6 DNA methylase [Chloroflexota bacterium]|nr:N-6 DNA methylase [Chloroflexota bacterium]